MRFLAQDILFPVSCVLLVLAIIFSMVYTPIALDTTAKTLKADVKVLVESAKRTYGPQAEFFMVQQVLADIDESLERLRAVKNHLEEIIKPTFIPLIGPGTIPLSMITAS